MNNFKIIPMSKEYAQQIRSNGIDEFGNPVIEQIASGLGPCRVSLKPFKKNVDRRLLFCHSPFAVNNAFNQPGPVFIQADDVAEYRDIYNFPAAIKADNVNFPLTLIGYNSAQLMVFTHLVGDADIDLLINEIFENHPEIEFLHARNAEACCYICKIERL